MFNPNQYKQIMYIIYNTQIVRKKRTQLLTFSYTDLPYIILARYSQNPQETTVREGIVRAEKPLILTPDEVMTFENFENLDEDVRYFLRYGFGGLPPTKYTNERCTLEIRSELLEDVLKHLQNTMDRKNDDDTALILCPKSEFWDISLLRYLIEKADESLPGNIRELIEKGLL